jgi:hypothetical protein
MSTFALWLAAALCALAGFGLGRLVRAASDEFTILGALRFAAWVGALIFAAVALMSMREMMSLTAQIGISVAIGGASMLLPRVPERQRTATTIATDLLAAVYFALFAFQCLHFGWDAPGQKSFLPLVLLASLGVFLVTSVRSLIVNWRDADVLEDEFGRQQGYIERRSAIPVRIRAVGLMLLLAAGLAAMAYIEIASLFAVKP